MYKERCFRYLSVINLKKNAQKPLKRELCQSFPKNSRVEN